MARNPSYEAIQQRLASLEKKLVDRDIEIKKLSRVLKNAERRLAGHSQYSLNNDQQIKGDLQTTPQMLKTLLDTIEGEIFIKDARGIYRYVNKAFGKDFGVDAEEIVGKDDYFVFPAETAALLQKNDQRIMTSKKPQNLEESTILKGRPLTYMTNKVPLIDEQGKVYGICGVGFDITRQKQLEAALKKAQTNLLEQVDQRTAELTATVTKLRRAEERYRMVADFTFDWEYWANLDGTLNYVSPSCERVSGYTRREFVDKPSLFKEIILPEDRGIWENHYHDSRRKREAQEIQFRIRHRDGTVRWIEHICQPVIGDQSTLLGFRASNRDITKRKQNELQLQDAYTEIKSLKAQLEADQTYLREEIKLGYDYGNIIGSSEVMQYTLFRAQQIAQTDSTVLIQGETGTGKELIARAIHNASKRNERPLIKVDCASLSANLIESELFGHEKGAFTHAVEKRVGRFELANGATIFLDEIGELPLEMQPKLLRVLQDGEFERLGSSKTLHTDARIIAATNRDLEADVREKKFRMDLWYRLNIFTISVPPLRERGDDIELLVDHMIRHIARRLGKQVTSVPSKVIAQLKNHSWPGNVRELENVIERAIIYTPGDQLRLDEKPDRPPMADKAAAIESIKPLCEVERDHILLALRQTNWQLHGKDGAAALLDINPSTLRGRMRKHKIQRPPFDPA